MARSSAGTVTLTTPGLSIVTFTSQGSYPGAAAAIRCSPGPSGTAVPQERPAHSDPIPREAQPRDRRRWRDHDLEAGEPRLQRGGPGARHPLALRLPGRERGGRDVAKSRSTPSRSCRCARGSRRG